MANNLIYIKRTAVSGRTPNTTSNYVTNSQYIATGELALNLTDKKLFSSDGTNYFEVGANLVNLQSNTITVGNSIVNSVINSTSLTIGSSVVNTSAINFGAGLIANSSGITNGGTFTANSLSVVKLVGPAITSQSNTGLSAYIISNNGIDILAVSNGTANGLLLSNSGNITLNERFGGDANFTGITQNFTIDNAPLTVSAKNYYGNYQTFRNHSLSSANSSTLGILFNGLNSSYNSLIYNGLNEDNVTPELTYMGESIGLSNEIRNYSTISAGDTIGMDSAKGIKNVIKNYSNTSLINTTYGLYNIIQASNNTVTANITTAIGVYNSIGLNTLSSSIGNAIGIYTAFANNVANATGIQVLGEKQNIFSNTIYIGNSTVNTTVNTSAFIIGNTSSSVYSISNVSTHKLASTGVNTTIVYNSYSLQNSSSNVSMNPSSLYIQGGITSGNVTINSTAHFTGNSTVNTTINSSSFNINTTLFVANTTKLLFTPNTFILGTSTVASNGYTYLPNGLKLNFGTVSVNSTVGAITFTSAFTTACYSIQVTSNTVGSTNIPSVTAISITTATVLNSNVIASNCYYMAIGA